MGLGRRFLTTTAATLAAAGMTIGLTGPATALSDAETNDFLGQLTASYTDPTVESDEYLRAGLARILKASPSGSVR